MVPTAAPTAPVLSPIEPSELNVPLPDSVEERLAQAEEDRPGGRVRRQRARGPAVPPACPGVWSPSACRACRRGVEARDERVQGRLSRPPGRRPTVSVSVSPSGLCLTRLRVTPSIALVTVLLVLVIERPSTVTWAVRPIVWALVVPGASLRAAPRLPLVSLMSIATAPVSLRVRISWSLVRSIEAMTPAVELLMRLMIVGQRVGGRVVGDVHAVDRQTPVLVDVRPVRPALSSEPAVRATPRFVGR